MSSPRICPPPPDCPLYARRLDYAQDEPLRRAVLTERRTSTDLAGLIREEAAGQRPASTPGLPAPTPDLTSLMQKGATHA